MSTKHYLLAKELGVLKDVLVSLFSYRARKKKYGEYYLAEVAAMREARADASHAAYQRVADKKLADLLAHAYQHIPHFFDVFEQKNITLTDIHQSPRSALTALPLMTKAQIKDTPELFTDSALKAAAVQSTSGTTGSPLYAPHDLASYQRIFAYWRLFYDQMTLPEQFRNVRFSGNVLSTKERPRRPWVHDWAEQRLYMSCYHLTDELIPRYLDKINKFKPELIDGYTSAIEALAIYIVGNAIKLSFTPRAIATTAESLSESQRQIIEQAFGCKVFNQYASAEGAPFITECKEGSLHLNTDTGVFEFMDAPGEGDSSRVKELVVTSFRNYMMPLIRYRMGDTVTLAATKEACVCGSPFPIVDEIGGRKEDVLFSKQRGVVGRVTPIFRGIWAVRKAQVVQHTLSRFEILIEPNGVFPKEAEELLRANFHKRLGAALELEIRVVESIPLSKNGKFRTVVNHYGVPATGVSQSQPNKVKA